jgi:prohibitin 1
MLFLLSIVIVIGAISVWFNARKKVRNEQNMMFKTTASGAGLVALVFVLIALSQLFTVVPAGNVGVVDFFGTVSNNTLKAGINFVNPLARVVKFSVQTQ